MRGRSIRDTKIDRAARLVPFAQASEEAARAACWTVLQQTSLNGDAVKVNLFAGARRIALLVGVLWASGCIAFAVFTEPYIREATYLVPKPGDAPVLTEAQCEGETTDIVRKTPTGGSINVSVCFPFLPDESHVSAGRTERPFGGKRFIPLIDRSSEIATYERSVDRLLPLEQVVAASEARKRQALLAQWKDAMVALFGGLAVGWILVIAIGWIARGFMGIPTGKDAPIQSD